ncbi:Hypothetical predicted protein [Podarcis lilfordi]|uniref:Uncharacterized protein n=1 Tax=Podarcis lilfordi TaxID=74358 RepID=A0AA35NSU0_9SAUR|nr:Hypothetical predicted protein [Podarcis lilfordi]
MLRRRPGASAPPSAPKPSRRPCRSAALAPRPDILLNAPQPSPALPCAARVQPFQQRMLRGEILPLTHSHNTHTHTHTPQHTPRKKPARRQTSPAGLGSRPSLDWQQQQQQQRGRFSAEFRLPLAAFLPGRPFRQHPFSLRRRRRAASPALPAAAPAAAAAAAAAIHAARPASNGTRPSPTDKRRQPIGASSGSPGERGSHQWREEGCPPSRFPRPPSPRGRLLASSRSSSPPASVGSSASGSAGRKGPSAPGGAFGGPQRRGAPALPEALFKVASAIPFHLNRGIGGTQGRKRGGGGQIGTKGITASSGEYL